MNVVAYRPKFKADYRTLNLEWIEKYFAVEQKDIEQVDNPEQCLHDGGQIFFIVEQGEAVATCAMYKVKPGIYELAKMAVRPSHQGKGYGDLLMKTAEIWAREQNASAIILLSNTILAPAIKLYKKHGFATTHLGPHPDYKRCNIEMKKILN